MVVITHNQQARTQRFVIQPNSSLSWPQVIIYFLIIAGTCLAVAVYFTFKGAWMVLPFAGAEILLLGAAFYISARRCSLKEVISISSDTLYIERGRHSVEQQFEFTTAWTKVALKPPKYKNYPSRLMIGSHGRLIEIARDLCEQEKKKLANDLRSSLDDVIQASL